LAQRVAEHWSDAAYMIGTARVLDRSSVFVQYDDGWRMLNR
jgi:hypothetical protein